MPDGTTRETHAIRVLAHHDIAAPLSFHNILYLVSQANAEFGSSASFAAYNPEATTRKEPGSTDFNSSRVQNYVSSAQGVWATVQTLTSGLYDPIVASLRDDKSAGETWAALLASPWGTSVPGGLSVADYLLDVQKRWGVVAQRLI